MQGYTLVKQVFYCLSQTTSPFCPDYFGNNNDSEELMNANVLCGPLYRKKCVRAN
jgi:hypothetical protein